MHAALLTPVDPDHRPVLLVGFADEPQLDSRIVAPHLGHIEPAEDGQHVLRSVLAATVAGIVTTVAYVTAEAVTLEVDDAGKATCPMCEGSGRYRHEKETSTRGCRLCRRTGVLTPSDTATLHAVLRTGVGDSTIIDMQVPDWWPPKVRV